MNNNGESLITDLISNPSLFFSEGRSYQLLQAYFKGMQLDTLIPLLKSDEIDIQKTVVWIISELGNKACDLLSYVLPLVNSEVPYIRYYTFECILLCADGKHVNKFIHILKGIDDKDNNVRVFAMQLFSNASDNQIKSLLRFTVNESLKDMRLHRLGIEKFLQYSKLYKKDILDMLNSIEPITQKYGVMIAKKRYRTNPELLNYALLSNDFDISEFSRMEIDLLKE